MRIVRAIRRRPRSTVAVIAGLAGLVWFVLPWCVPVPDQLLKNPDASPVVLDRHGQVISRLALPDFTRSTPVGRDRLPKDLIDCTLAAEDKRFYRHGGVDLLATGRAAKDLFSKRRVVSGASTITQQLIKISSPPTRRGPLTKIREALAARHLEMTWDKGRILNAYLNRLDYGNLRTGATEAAAFYFQKPLRDLSLAECALLAGLPQAPSRLNPIRHPDRAIARRNVVLQRLATHGQGDAERIRAAMAEPLNLRPLRDTRVAPWLAALTPEAGDAEDPVVARRSREIRTTIDLDLQRDVEAIVRQETAKLRSANLRHAAVVVIDNPSGEVLALVGSADWDDPRGGQINGAFSPRSPGSTLKPFTYLLAMERNQRTPASILEDIPSPFRTPEGLNLPENYDRRYRGPVTLRTALACSLNVPAMRELNAMGGPAPLHELLGRLGVTTLGADPAAAGLGLTIGNSPVSLLELTNAYATLARMGEHRPALLFPGSGAPAPGRPLLRSDDCLLIADILSDSSARAPAFPPGSPLDLPFRCAVKTGTSSDFRDNWCVGYTPAFTVGVWAGNFENQPMKGISGVTGAAPVFHRTMVRLHRERPPVWPEFPASIRPVTIDVRTGKSLEPESVSPYARRDRVPSDRMPPPAVDADYDADGRALVSSVFTAWFRSPQNQRSNELALHPEPVAVEPLRVITPADGAVFLLDPEVPSGTGRLRPVTNLPGIARWESPTLRIESGEPEPVIHLSPGTHTLTATDTRTGVVRALTLHVRTM